MHPDPLAVPEETSRPGACLRCRGQYCFCSRTERGPHRMVCVSGNTHQRESQTQARELMAQRIQGVAECPGYDPVPHVMTTCLPGDANKITEGAQMDLREDSLELWLSLSAS